MSISTIEIIPIKFVENFIIYNIKKLNLGHLIDVLILYLMKCAGQLISEQLLVLQSFEIVRKVGPWIGMLTPFSCNTQQKMTASDND